MKKIIVCTFVLAVAIQGIKAQDEPRRQERHIDRHHRDQRDAFHNLNLTEDQKAKFKSVNDDFRNQMQDLRKNEDITVRESKSSMEKLRTDHRAKMQGLLTSDQKAQLEKNRVEREIRHKADAESRMERMKTRLNLSDDQSTRLRQNRAQMDEKMKTLRENKSLNDQERRDQINELRKKNRESLKTILTEDQLKKLHQSQTHRTAKQPV